VDEDQALDPGRPAAQHQGRLAFADRRIEDGGAADLGDKSDPSGLLNGAIAVAARSDTDRPLAVPDRADRVGEMLEAPVALDNGERRGGPCRRKGGGGGENGNERKQADGWSSLGVRLPK
jgi:hypothetical protein